MRFARYFNFVKQRLLLIFLWNEKHVEVVKKQKKKRENKESFGSLFYLGDLLDRLEDYFSVIKFFKKNDIDSYNLYKKAGAQIMSKDVLYQQTTIHPYIKEKRPSFFMLHIRDGNYTEDENGKNEPMSARLIYFHKMEWRQGLQTTKHDIYKVCLYYRSRTKDYGVAGFWVAVDPCGNVYPIKERGVTYKNVKGHKKGYRKVSVPQVIWKHSEFLEYFLKDLKQQAEEGKESIYWKTATTQDLALNIFSVLINSFFNSYSGFQINVTNTIGCVANFNIDMLRTPYFFKDRKKTVNENGKTKKIFHIVRTHKRKFLDKEVYIKTHFRGLRKFTWNGYQVLIQNPKQEINLRTFDAAGVDSDNIDPALKLIDHTEFGKRIHAMRS